MYTPTYNDVPMSPYNHISQPIPFSYAQPNPRSTSYSCATHGLNFGVGCSIASLIIIAGGGFLIIHRCWKRNGQLNYPCLPVRSLAYL